MQSCPLLTHLYNPILRHVLDHCQGLGQMLGALIILLAASTISLLSAASLPSGFSETQIASGLPNATAMAFAPDGRLFVCLQGGQLRVIKNGALLSTPFLTVTVNSSGERGLLGVSFDPNFNTNQYVYIYYTATTPAIHNRVSRFTANGDVALPGSEIIIFELNNLSGATNHNGGAIHFGSDGKLYVAVGENANASNSQTLANLLGKILRINADGSIPTDNPFYGSATGDNKAIWALGLRNPYTFAFQSGTGRMFINDVGQSAWEEIDDGVAGLNYGWPTCEGACSTPNPSFRDPLFQYGHGSTASTGCAITGGAFYNPQTQQFPPDYVGKYFFADFCTGWIRRFDPATNTTTDFASAISSPVDLHVAADGSLYYLARGTGSVYRIQYTANLAPNITTNPSNQTVSAGKPATFTVEASGAAPLSYQWQRNSATIPGANASSYTITNATTADNGAQFRAVVSNAYGSATSNNATLTVTANNAPTGTISAPASGALYSAGDTINYAGTASDPEDGNLSAGAFTWQVDFHHENHIHPFISATTGATSGSFVIPTTGEISANVWYRIYLTVADSGGLSHTSFRDLLPRKAMITLGTNPAGLVVTLDGQPQTAPYSTLGVVGITRTLGVFSPQIVNGTTYEFDSWSDGGVATHNIDTPVSNTIFTATFNQVPGPPPRFFQFSASSYGVAESAGGATIKVTRSGDNSSPATVDYATSNGTASDRSDYTAMASTLSFAPGETIQRFVVLVADDAYVEGNETVNIALSNPTGGLTNGIPNTAVLAITDNDTVAPTFNPADDAQFFVRQHYADFLSRMPDPAGLNYWADRITQCGQDAVCVRQRRIDISAAFFLETEFQQTGSFIYRIFKGTLGRSPTYAEFTLDRARVIGGSGLQVNRMALLAEFVQRPAFKSAYPDTMTNLAFVNRLFDTAGLIPFAVERQQQVDAMVAGKTRAQVIGDVIETQTFKDSQFNPSFVLMQFFGYLRRDPEPEGYDFWLDVLNNRESNNFRGMVCSFITSFEYQDRFSPVRTRRNRDCSP
jgi:glucose/arabinose dehydrogenase